MEKQLIVLNGPSSSGKSTLALALQALIEETRQKRFEIVSIDDYLSMSKDVVIYEDDVYAISGALSERVDALLSSAPGVIVDHVITSERIFSRLTELNQPHRLRLILVSCPPEVLRRREAARGNRCPGSAEASLAYLFPTDGYELRVDTHLMTPEECARLILDAL